MLAPQLYQTYLQCYSWQEFSGVLCRIVSNRNIIDIESNLKGKFIQNSTGSDLQKLSSRVQAKMTYQSFVTFAEEVSVLLDRFPDENEVRDCRMKITASDFFFSTYIKRFVKMQ